MESDDFIKFLNEGKNNRMCSFGISLTNKSDPLDTLMTCLPNDLYIDIFGFESADLDKAVKLINENKINNLVITPPYSEDSYKNFIKKINNTNINIKFNNFPSAWNWNIMPEYVSLIERNPLIKTLELDYTLKDVDDAKLLGEALSKREPFDLVLKPCSDMATYNAFVASLGENAPKWQKLCQDIKPE